MSEVGFGWLKNEWLWVVAGRDLANERNGKMAGREEIWRRKDTEKMAGTSPIACDHRPSISTMAMALAYYYGIDFSTMLHNTFQSGGYPFSLHMGWGVAVLVLAFIRCH